MREDQCDLSVTSGLLKRSDAPQRNLQNGLSEEMRLCQWKWKRRIELCWCVGCVRWTGRGVSVDTTCIGGKTWRVEKHLFGASLKCKVGSSWIRCSCTCLVKAKNNPKKNNSSYLKLYVKKRIIKINQILLFIIVIFLLSLHREYIWVHKRVTESTTTKSKFDDLFGCTLLVTDFPSYPHTSAYFWGTFKRQNKTQCTKTMTFCSSKFARAIA